jgi:hypothetical protein
MEILLRRMMTDQFSSHGFRSGFRDWVGDQTHFPREVAEAALARRVGDTTELAYRRNDALDRRRQLMQAWARHCLSITAYNVIPLRATNDHQ